MRVHMFGDAFGKHGGFLFSSHHSIFGMQTIMNHGACTLHVACCQCLVWLCEILRYAL